MADGLLEKRQDLSTPRIAGRDVSSREFSRHLRVMQEEEVGVHGWAHRNHYHPRHETLMQQ